MHIRVHAEVRGRCQVLSSTVPSSFKTVSLYLELIASARMASQGSSCLCFLKLGFHGGITSPGFFLIGATSMSSDS